MDIGSSLVQIAGNALIENEPMARHTTLKVGGPARWFWAAADLDQLAQVLELCERDSIPFLFLGHGSNVLFSDKGFDGLVIKNRCKAVEIGAETLAESGVSFGSLFLQTAQAGYAGLEWAIGIPGTVGGALVSNAGAYRGNIGPLVSALRVYAEGRDQWVGPEWMEFSYRDSRLRRAGAGREIILSCRLHLPDRDAPEAIMARAKEYQAQRRGKQPYAPSAGSFFKNVLHKTLAAELPGLTNGMREAGVVPAGFLIEAAGLKGMRFGGAEVSEKHANFLINADQATASDIRALAECVKERVREQFHVSLEEEALYLGNW